MSKQTKKTVNTVTPIKSSFPKKAKASEKMRQGKEIQKDLFKGGEKLSKKLANHTNEVSAQVIDIHSYNAQAWNEFGNVAMDVFNNINNEVMENYRDSVSNCVEASMEMLKCKNANDLANLQRKALQRMIESCFDQSSKFSKALFENYANALQQVNDSALVDSTDDAMHAMNKLLTA